MKTPCKSCVFAASNNVNVEWHNKKTFQILEGLADRTGLEPVPNQLGMTGQHANQLNSKIVAVDFYCFRLISIIAHDYISLMLFLFLMQLFYYQIFPGEIIAREFY